MSGNSLRRDIFLKIEKVAEYSPLAPILCARRYGRDCMFNEGHESGRLTGAEIFAASLDALVYREYLDTHYTVPNTAKIVRSDVNEPPWDRRVPGAVLYAQPGERLYIHVLNGDPDACHSFHLHGLKYGIESDGAWPFGVRARDGRRSDEIKPGERWTYVFDATPETVGTWAFHDHAHDVQVNVNRGLFGGLIVRDPSQPCADEEVPIFVHQMAAPSLGCTFQSPTLSNGQSFSFTFGTEPSTCRYHCLIHGVTMSGQVEVASGNPMNATVRTDDNYFTPAAVRVAPGGTVTWTNAGASDHIVYAAGGGGFAYCLNGRTYVGNTPTIVADSGRRLRWYLFNLDLGGAWHNFHPHSMRWQLPAPPGTAADVHSLSPVETFTIDTEVPPAIRLSRELEELQCEPPPDACRVSIKGDYLFHCHIEGHMMQGLAGLVRARQKIWLTEALAKTITLNMPYDDGLNTCPTVDLDRCVPPRGRITAPATPGPAAHAADHPGGPGMGSMAMGGMGGTSATPVDVALASTRGLWELLPCDSQVLAVHAALLRTGKVLFFAGSGNDEQYTKGLRSVVWDYENGTFHQPITPIDFFCAGQSFLPDGRLLVAGGTEKYDPFIGLKSAYLFDPLTEEWIRVQDMAVGRWYPTLLTLGDGRVLAASGGNDLFEAYANASGWTPLFNRAFALYPHMFLLRDGRVFLSGGNAFGSVTPGRLNLGTGAYTTIPIPATFNAGHRDQSASVLLPPAQGQRVMILGGGDPAINRVHIANLAGGSPSYVAAPSLAHARMHVNAVLLPDRTVFVSGGNGAGEARPTAVLESEIYHPATNSWSLGATATVPRMYHSVALLLPDGRVIAAGSNPNRRDDELRLELYHPPYLFRGPRPFIERAPSALAYGQQFAIDTPRAADIKWVQLVRPMATTHSCDTEQRLVDVPFRREGLCRLVGTVPNNPNIAPPGWYMLFITDDRDVPSVASWVHVGVREIQPPSRLKAHPAGRRAPAVRIRATGPIRRVHM